MFATFGSGTFAIDTKSSEIDKMWKIFFWYCIKDDI